MTDAPKPPATEPIPCVAGGVSALASAHAPVIFAEAVPAYGFRDGIVTAVLEVQRINFVEQTPLLDRVVVAHLKLITIAAKQFVKALTTAITMGEKPEGPVN